MSSSDLVVAALTRAGGTAPRETITTAVARHRGRREAYLGIEMAVLGRRVEEILLADGIAGLRLASVDDTTFPGQLDLPEETARPALVDAVRAVRRGSGARGLKAAGAQSRPGGER